MGLVGRLAVAALACGPHCAEQPQTAPPRRVLAAPPVSVPPSCGPGLLCEDGQLLTGFRVPRGCRVDHVGKWASRCTLADIAPDGRAVHEFLTSRYPVVQRLAPGVLWAEAPQVGTLTVTILGNHSQFLAIPELAPQALDTTGAGR